MLGLSIFVFNADSEIYLMPFFVFLGMYLVAFVATLLVDIALRHVRFSVGTVVKIILRNIKEDLLTPIMFLKELFSNLLAFITSLIPIKRNYKWHSNKLIVAFAILYVLIAVVEIVAFCKINSF